jgi:choline transport protein
MGPVVGPVVNVIGLVYSAITLLFSFLPSTAKVTPVTMNWSCLIFGATVLFSLGYYFVYGRYVYKWPIVDSARRFQ